MMLKLYDEYKSGRRDFIGENLEGAVIQHVDLSGINLREANLMNADFSGTIFRGGDLQHANLRGASLLAADLRGTDVRNSQLQGAVLTDADLRGTLWTQSAVPHPIDLRRKVFEYLSKNPHMFDPSLMCDGSSNPACPHPGSIFAWACHLGGGARCGHSIHTSAHFLLWSYGLPMPDDDLLALVHM